MPVTDVSERTPEEDPRFEQPENVTFHGFRIPGIHREGYVAFSDGALAALSEAECEEAITLIGQGYESAGLRQLQVGDRLLDIVTKLMPTGHFFTITVWIPGETAFDHHAVVGADGGVDPDVARDHLIAFLESRPRPNSGNAEFLGASGTPNELAAKVRSGEGEGRDMLSRYIEALTSGN